MFGINWKVGRRETEAKKEERKKFATRTRRRAQSFANAATHLNTDISTIATPTIAHAPRQNTSRHQVQRRPVAVSGRTGNGALGSSPAMEEKADDTIPPPNKFYSEYSHTPGDSSTQDYLQFEVPTSSGNFYDGPVTQNEPVQDFRSERASEGCHKKGVEREETNIQVEPDTEESSDDESSLNEDIKTPKAQVNKQEQMIQQLRMRNERYAGHVEGVQSSMKALYEEQSRERDAHAAISAKLQEKLQEMTNQHAPKEGEAPSGILVQMQELEIERKKFKNEKQELEKEKGEFEKEKEAFEIELGKELDKEKMKHEEASKTLKEKHSKDLENRDSKFNAKVAELNSEKDSQTREIGVLNRRHEEALRQATEPLQTEIRSMVKKREMWETEKARELQTIQEEHEKALGTEHVNSEKLLTARLSELERLNKIGIETMKREQNEALRLETEKLENSQNVLADPKPPERTSSINSGQSREIAANQDTYSETIEKMKRDREAEVTKMRREHEAEVVKMRKDNKVATAQLEEDNEAFRILLYKRNVFKATTDVELEDRFAAVCGEVDEVARVEWNKFRVSSWPFSELSLQHSKMKRAKQRLIKNTLWVILYERIFCTPYRVLGSQGRLLETQWTQEFGQEYDPDGVPCPRATKESEEWRYCTIVKYAEAIKETLPNLESIKEEYESTLEDISNELFHELENVAAVSDMVQKGIDRNRVSELVKKAATFWLEIGKQKFRIQLVMSKTGETPLRSRQKALGPSGTLSLVEYPELRRLGNAQGEHLELEELVMGREGKFSVFPTCSDSS